MHEVISRRDCLGNVFDYLLFFSARGIIEFKGAFVCVCVHTHTRVVYHCASSFPVASLDNEPLRSAQIGTIRLTKLEGLLIPGGGLPYFPRRTCKTRPEKHAHARMRSAKPRCRNTAV